MSKERDALAHAFSVLKLLGKHSLSPTQTRLARRAAGHCLWALGVDRFEEIEAVPIEGEVIDLEVTKLIPGAIEPKP